MGLAIGRSVECIYVLMPSSTHPAFLRRIRRRRINRITHRMRQWTYSSAPMDRIKMKSPTAANSHETIRPGASIMLTCSRAQLSSVVIVVLPWMGDLGSGNRVPTENVHDGRLDAADERQDPPHVWFPQYESPEADIMGRLRMGTCIDCRVVIRWNHAGVETATFGLSGSYESGSLPDGGLYCSRSQPDSFEGA